MEELNELCDMIDTYGGRDKIMKALCYSAKLIGGCLQKSSPVYSKKFSIISSKISGARATLRLIDDFPMIQYAIEYGLGKKENDKAMSALGVIANVTDLIYYPIEKICWLSEHRVINVENPDKWDTISSAFWVISIYLNLMRTLRNLTLIEQHKSEVIKTDNSRETYKNLLAKQRMEIISVVRLTLDLTYAVSTLPKGTLWGGKLKTWQCGLVGTASAFIGIYQYLWKKRNSK